MRRIQRDADMRRFRELTMGRTVVMGRRTYESIMRGVTQRTRSGRPVEPLPGRHALVLSRQPGYEAPGCRVMTDARWSAFIPRREDPVIVGGADVYAQALPYCHLMHLTIVDSEWRGDALFPDWENGGEWDIVDSERAEGCTFLMLNRVTGGAPGVL